MKRLPDLLLTNLALAGLFAPAWLTALLLSGPRALLAACVFHAGLAVTLLMGSFLRPHGPEEGDLGWLALIFVVTLACLAWMAWHLHLHL